MTEDKIQIGISSCLLGEQVRFDGGHKRNGFIVNVLSRFFTFVPFCPEVAIGLGIPRPSIRQVADGEKIICVDSKGGDIDYSERLSNTADEQKFTHLGLSGYIVKKDSPSCGMERVKVYHKHVATKEGVGLFTQRLMENFPHLPVEEEGRLNDPVLRENFLQRVFIYHRWRKLAMLAPSWSELSRFHARHKYIYMSHNQNKARQLGKWLAQNHDKEVGRLYSQYLEQMTALLKIRATVKTHVNTLAHIQGYLKNHLSRTDKQELAEVFEQYRQGDIPLIVPITLLKHHFRHHPQQYIADSYYLQPYPSELRLLNSL